ncbi:MAG: DUF4157 domain-containing protein [Nitrolancea sp.]
MRERFGYSIGRISIFPPSMDGGNQTIQRAPDPAAAPTSTGDDSVSTEGDGAVPTDTSKAASGSTTIQDPPTMQTTTVHGTKLATVASALGDEPGSVEFDFSVATQGDPATSATLTVTQTLTLPQWAERDAASGAAKSSWDRFVGALTQHENGHLAIDRQMFANAHQRFVGNTAAQVEQTSNTLRAAVQAKQDAFDTQTDHGRNGNPPTILDIGPDAIVAPKSATAVDQNASAEDEMADPAGLEPAPPELQARLFISPADDPYEREANVIADQVMRAGENNQPISLDVGSAPRRAQRLCTQCAKTLDEGEGSLCPECAEKAARDERQTRLSRKEADETPESSTQHVPSVVNDTLRTTGEPLDREMRTQMEGRFGHDFSRVRILSDEQASESARAINAQAYTVGEQIVFGGGHYAPQTESGRWLLAHELTHVIQQRGEAVAPLSADGRAIQRDEDVKEDFDTEQRRLIRDAKTVGDVKDINPQAFHLASDDDRYRLIGLLLNQGWVGPRDEYYLEHIWGSFGKNLQSAATKGNVLWNLCIDRGADLWNLAELVPMKEKFKADVVAKTRDYLGKNRTFVQNEQKNLGLDNAQAAPTADQNKALADLRETAKQVEAAEQKQAALPDLKVGYNPIPYVGDDPLDMRPEKDRWDIQGFDPDTPPKHSGPVGFESEPMPTWEATNAEYHRLDSTIKGFAKKHPSIYALRRDLKISSVARETDDAKTRETIGKSLQDVLDNIATTEGKLADPKSTLPLELHPIHEQLYAAPGSPWSEPFGKGVAKQAIKGYEDAKWWKEIGVDALQLALFVVAEIATGGAAVFVLAINAGVGAARAEQDWETWQEKSAAEGSGMSDETKLLESGEADAALITAVLDTATAFLDLYGAASAAVREAKGVATLEGRLAEAEAKEAGGAIEAEIKQKQNWEFRDDVAGEAHSAHATEHGLEICSDPPCLIAPQRMRQRFAELSGTPDPDTARKLNGLIANAQENSNKWGQLVTEMNDPATWEREKAALVQREGPLSPAKERLRRQQFLSSYEQRMNALADEAGKFETGFQDLEREHRILHGLEATEGMAFPVGRSDIDVRRALRIPDNEPCADILADQGFGHWVAGESKGSDIPHALEQMEHTETVLRTRSAEEASKATEAAGKGLPAPAPNIGLVNDVEYRIYPNQATYDQLKSEAGMGLSKYRVDDKGLLTQDGVLVNSPSGKNIRIYDPRETMKI